MSNIYRAKGIKLESQYEDVGRLYKKYLNKQIEIDHKKMQMVERVLLNVRSHKALNTFYKCFAGWARGAGLSEEAAMYLLADNTSGCQTAIVRYGSGVALLHTEEDYYDVKARMSGVHTIEFSEGGRILKCLTYNDLMPGAGLYGWQKDMVVAVDSLFLSEDGIFNIEQPMLANIIAWMIWYENPTNASAEYLVKKLKPLGTLVDGYAVNVVRRGRGGIEGYKLTFARDEWEIEKLGSNLGDNLRQVNIVEPQYARNKRPIAKYRHAPWKMAIDHYGFLKRLRDMNNHLSIYKKIICMELQKDKIAQTHLMIHRIIFEKYPKYYVTEWMGAMCVGLIDNKLGLSVSTKLSDNQPVETVEYIDHS
ncbi:MAG: hypothetical protein E6R05_02470 [Candidatus Moraniibacteriota bacterium]|nr:MAG: hypothetical protein E6R05_02470 [Candidatus Moranbacteria bacterium]